MQRIVKMVPRSARRVALGVALLLAAAVLPLVGACGSSGGSNGETAPDAGDSSPPSRPVGLTATSDGPFGIALSWQGSTDNIGVAEYRVERCEGTGCSAFSAAASATSTAIVDAGLAAATEYRYRVQAVDAAGNASEYSDVVAAVTGSTPPPPLGNLPAWVAALSPGQWTAIPNTAISRVTPSPVPPGSTGPESKVIAWTSFALDSRSSRVYSLANGGHNDYSGNEVDLLDLEADPPAWTQVLGPTPAGQLSSSCQSYNGDGRPASRHTYYGVTFNEPSDRFMLFAGAQWCFGGGFHRAVSSFNIGARSWSPAGTHPSVPDEIAQGVPAVTAIPGSGDVYLVRSFTLVKWTRSSNSMSTLGFAGAAPYGDDTMSAYDSTRGRILYAGGLATDRHQYNVATNTFSTVNFSGSNAGQITGAGGGAMVYVPAIDRFLVRRSGGGGAVYQIHPTTFAVSAFTTSGGGSIPATINGPYNKFLYVPRLGGVVYVPEYGTNAWFLRVH